MKIEIEQSFDLAGEDGALRFIERVKTRIAMQYEAEATMSMTAWILARRHPSEGYPLPGLGIVELCTVGAMANDPAAKQAFSEFIKLVSVRADAAGVIFAAEAWAAPTREATRSAARKAFEEGRETPPSQRTDRVEIAQMIIEHETAGEGWIFAPITRRGNKATLGAWSPFRATELERVGRFSDLGIKRKQRGN
jgi:hypothetical protein